MSKSNKTLEFEFERVILATPAEVYKAWLNPKTPGTPWHEGAKLILNPKVDGFFYWLMRGNSHYGRFIKLKPGALIKKTWMSRSTLGEESIVKVTFKKHGNDTLMTLSHSNLPNAEAAKAHVYGWNYFLDKLNDHFAQNSRGKKPRK